MAKQSPTLMGLGPKYYIQGSFNLIHSHKLFFYLFAKNSQCFFFTMLGLLLNKTTLEEVSCAAVV